MKREHGLSSISRFLQRNPAWSQVVCVVGVALLIILGPILLYGLLFQSGPDSARMLSNVPWWPVVLLVALVALLSLLHGTTGVSVQKQPDRRKSAGAAADSPELSAPSKPPEPPAPSEPTAPPTPTGPSGPPGPSGQNGDPLQCTMHERSLNGMSRVETNP
ncbi:MAG: hypothetical protein F4Y38_03065 [Gemmatimonadetes bacterium]|nr:hypothetical protein [Gemmatimonadota bacterium]MYG86056.1 hypothetical protein [Gemmatimonadota bacterium]MYJ90982.1 hypothetical protein [Gemmatimonadota bacterium]